MSKQATPPSEEVVAERALEKLTPDGPRPAKVTIYKPVQIGQQEWHCRYVISGVKDTTVDRTGVGVDSVQALSGALFLVGVAFIREPVVAEHGYAAWDSPPRSRADDTVPLPSSSRRLGGAVPAPRWLEELDEGVTTLRALRDWLEAAGDGADVRERMAGLERGMRHLQTAGPLPVHDADIARVTELRAALATPQTDLLPLVEKCLLWWTRAGQR